MPDQFGGIEIDDTEQDEFGGVAVAVAEPELTVPAEIQNVQAGPSPLGMMGRFLPLVGSMVQPKVSTAEGLIGSAEKGLERGIAIPDVLQAVATKPGFSTETRPAALGMTAHFLPAVRGLLQSQQANIPWFKETVSDIAQQQQKISEIPQSPAQRRMAAASTQSEKWKAWLQDPVELTAAITLESLPPSIAGAAAGAVGGPTGMAVGLGSASALAEFSSTFLDEASKRNYNVKDAQSLEAFLNDSRAYNDAVDKGLKRAFVVGGVDAATGGAAGSFLKPALAQGLKQRIIASGKELGLQAAGGAAGETAGQIVTGQPLDPFDIAMEAIAEIGTGPVEVASNLRDRIEVTQPTSQTPQPISPPPVQEQTINLPLLEETESEQNAIQPQAETVLRNVQQPEVAPQGEVQVPAEVSSPQTSETLTQPGLTPGEIEAVGFFPAVSEAQGLGEQSMPPTLQDVRDKRKQDEKAAEALPPPTADEVLDKPHGSTAPESIEAMSDEEFNKLIDGSRGRKYSLTVDATAWAMSQKSGPELIARLKKLRDAETESNKKALSEKNWDRRDRSQWYSDALHVLEGSEVGLVNAAKVKQMAEQGVVKTVPSNVVPLEQGSEPRRAVGFFPRQSEALGLGEPSMPPTVEDVQRQREQDKRESGIAPGKKTKESEGTWFSGKNPQETARMMQARADAFLKDRTDEQAIVDLARVAGGDPDIQLDHQAYNFAIKDLLVKINRQIQSTKNPVYQVEAWKQIDRLAELSRRIGAEDARSLVSRQLAYKQIDWLMPVLAWRGIVQEKWKKALKIPDNKTVNEVLNETVPTPEEVADAVEEEVERNEAERSAQSIIDKLAEYQSDTLKWPKWKVDGVRETVKWYILGDIADGEFQATMDNLKVDLNTARVLLGVANREFVIREGWRQRKTAEQKARRQNEAEMRTLRARAYIAFKMGTEAERTVDSILNEFAKTQSDTPTWTPKVYNQVREVFNGFMRGDITESEFRASLETVNVAGGKIGALLGVANRELQTREFYRQAKADEDLKKLVRDKDKIAALFRKLALGENINWRDMFLDNPRATQAERRKFLFDKIKSDPKFANLSKEEKVELERSLSEAWERQRMGVFRQEFGKLIKLPQVEIEKTVKELMPELIRQANLGTLDDSAFLNAFAKKLGLPEISGEKSNKITELSQKAQKEPQGVRRNKVMEEMIQLLQSGSDISKMDLLRDSWYGSVLMRVGTMLNVLAGSYSTGASFAGLAAFDRAIQLEPLQAIKILGQFIGGTIEGTLIADQIARKGAYHLLPDAEQRMVNLLSGKAGARFDNLEEMLRRGNPIGVLAYTRRFMAALDYIGALGTRDSQVLYGALTRGDQESLDALDKRYDRAENKRAEQQARAEMGPKASRAEVMVRKREILEEGVAEEIKENAIQVGRRAAQNAEPRGVPGWIYRLTAKIPFFARATFGLAFMRSAMNMVQNAADYMPGIGGITAIRGKLGTLPENHPLHVFGMDIPLEERRMMLAAQVSSLGIAAIAAAMFLGDDDEKEDGWEISGSWRGLTPKQKSQLMEMGERPNSIRFGKKSPWISFKQMPFAPPLAIVGTMRDEERFHAKDWEGQSVLDKIIPAWLTGWMYLRDISSLSGVAGMFDGNAWNTQETPANLTKMVNKFAAQSIGRAGTGYIPSVLKEIDEFGDATLYRPSKEEMSGWWIRNIPYARRTVGPGPALNNFGEPIQLTPPPIKSWAGFGKDNDLYNTLGKLASEGIFLPEPGNTAKIVDDDGNYREMTEDEWYQFIKIRGPIFKAGFNEGQLEWMREADKSEVVDWLQEHSNKSNDAARKELFPLTRIKALRRAQPE